jgi:DNA-binding NtrC family response regulator
MIKGNILIIDENRDSLDALSALVRKEFEVVKTLTNPNLIPEELRKNGIDMVVLDMNFKAGIHNGNEGLFWMREIFKYDSSISVIIVAGSGNIEIAVKAIREGAVDFILKPWDPSHLMATLNVAWKLRMSNLEAANLKNDNRRLKKEINRTGEKIILGASPTMINVMNIVRKVAGTDANVLITGENGTGKELVAREIHNLSSRGSELMVTVDMGSITETLFESELFGHARGAFTDAREERKGKIETAHKGTLFLDEIGNLSLQSQAKLLSVLQSRAVVRVGSNRPVPVDIRLICATNCDPVQKVLEGKFREDLLYRINTILIEVPPLRDRVDDIPVLANYFLRINAEKYGKGYLKFNTHALEKLANHNWPGNVRELQHCIEKAVILSDSPVLKQSDFAFTNGNSHAVQGEYTLEELEKKAIGDSLRRHNNNLSVVAAKLGITRQTLYNKIKRYRL